MPPITKENALSYHHLDGVPGKLSIIPNKPLNNQIDLGLAYTPGVAYPVLEIDRDPELVYEYTGKGNLVAVISNGTAILGLGNLGALACKPVMEGKSVLFKKFANLDSIDIEVDATDPDDLIRIIEAISPTFGGINLEDIKSPECFYIEQKLIEKLDIPVFHDDQHGTAIILGAALLNSLEIQNKKMDEIKIVFSGAGAAAIASGNHLVKLGVPREHIWMCDIHGLVYSGRKDEMFAEKAVFAQGEKPADLAKVLDGADMFIGLSAANVVQPEMLGRMREKPIIFAMANPDPEIQYDVAKLTRPDAIVGTGRSDYPNQVNNLLGFPSIFRGAMDVRALAITDEMKIAASHAIAELARQEVSREMLDAYRLNELEFGRDYVVPKPIDKRVCQLVAPAVAKAAMDCGVARREVDFSNYASSLIQRLRRS